MRRDEGQPTEVATAVGISGLRWADEATSVFKGTFAKATGVKGQANSSLHAVFTKVMNKQNEGGNSHPHLPQSLTSLTP